jgi:hypothetical protein
MKAKALTGCCIFWKNGKKTSFFVAPMSNNSSGVDNLNDVGETAEEIMQVVGALLKKFKTATIKQIQLLKDIYKCMYALWECLPD